MIVLDTQAWLWWMHDPSRLSRKAKAAVERAEKSGGIRVSVISVWEVAVKTQSGKLALPMELDEWYQRALAYPELIVEPLCAADAIESTRLPGTFHKDPADRIIMALSRRHGAALVTSDALIRAYPHVETVW
ncbi:MAG: type II toxin-antitoxin system VapC family toxin [Kiritimatiellae bacterium]|nr:type II toxin-antitoxin system VapC family toxin [Kiritimatiellia bacterium]